MSQLRNKRVNVLKKKAHYIKCSMPAVASPTLAPLRHAGVDSPTPVVVDATRPAGGSPAMRRRAALDGATLSIASVSERCRVAMD